MALQKAVNVMKDKVDIQCNKIFHLEDSMVMYGIHNSDTLEDLIKTVHKLHNTTTWNEKLFFRPNKRLVSLVFDNKRHKSICNKFHINFNCSKREICKCYLQSYQLQEILCSCMHIMGICPIYVVSSCKICVNNMCNICNYVYICAYIGHGQFHNGKPFAKFQIKLMNYTL